MPAKPGAVKSSLLLFILLLFNGTPSSAIQLSDVEWQKRPLLLFAPNQDSVRLLQTRQLIQQYSCELGDRDMIIAEIVALGNSIIDQQPVSAAYATTLRNQFDIPGKQFAVLLLGKDGGEKYRSYDMPDLDFIFALIDGMPMRQDEMQDNPVACSQ